MNAVLHHDDVMQDKFMRKFKFTDILIGIPFTLFFITIGVIIAVNFRSLYYFDINYLNIPKTSGYEKEVIIENYDSLINYNSPFYKGELKFPSLPSSKEALQHFSEVKRIFISCYYIAITMFLLCLGIILYKKKKRDKSYLLVSSITVIVLPLIVGIGCAINFDQAFVLFHKIFFRNKYWMFDPSTDPIINMLPDTYFLHALIIILLIVVLGSVTLFVASKLCNKKRHTLYIH